jgi:hypothetical protein
MTDRRDEKDSEPSSYSTVCLGLRIQKSISSRRIGADEPVRWELEVKE